MLDDARTTQVIDLELSEPVLLATGVPLVSAKQQQQQHPLDDDDDDGTSHYHYYLSLLPLQLLDRLAPNAMWLGCFFGIILFFAGLGFEAFLTVVEPSLHPLVYLAFHFCVTRATIIFLVAFGVSHYFTHRVVLLLILHHYDKKQNILSFREDEIMMDFIRLVQIKFLVGFSLGVNLASAGIFFVFETWDHAISLVFVSLLSGVAFLWFDKCVTKKCKEYINNRSKDSSFSLEK